VSVLCEEPPAWLESLYTAEVSDHDYGGEVQKGRVSYQMELSNGIHW
jgi:hypothetical protein